ncbi:Gamma-glutamylputrescine oxidoreductase [Thalassovita gelatinovora]|uniref:Gamma-glutamylputrescine oxidoreductase n=1 Tax=Thalassovita gelatinovora TaxID=53501 RepID=A0A0P1FMT5_THAGE|nr:FAD-binding oxidoreductase [Thalassovita gelatinovora]QIZ80980.1 FAD-binding oxidoreductase [Thalassovita gelatinovora]CUH63517.1 Gamma-glutamylputrescine oxidoreductase [Thalassovita gelatinovora]SEQ68552.1 Glycine/D-amino acid oxidase [Thalassovita gelatinovora]
MKRIMPNYAYGPGPRARCFWGPSTLPDDHMPPASGTIRTQFAVIGAGYTGLNAALHLAQAGHAVTLFDAESPGWGASARNGGFCCLGGAALPFKAIAKRYGQQGLQDWCASEVAAIKQVQDFLTRTGTDAETHSNGETILAHTPASMRELRAEQAELETNFGVDTTLIEAEDLAAQGMHGRFHGALTLPIGFGLNPRKYADGLSRACLAAGVTIHAQSPVKSVKRDGDGFTLQTPKATVRADKVIFATNGYSSEDVPDWMRARYMPMQSNVLVTRPLSPEEIRAGWSSDQMAYTHQTFLNYFRLMPNGQFLFGMRGGLGSSAKVDTALHRRTRERFEAVFPDWAHVETPYGWNGILAFSAKLAPYVGPVPELPGAFVGFAYHGNGVAMGSYAGALLADLAQGKDPERPYPALIRDVPKRFPLGRFRRMLIAPAYAYASMTGK